LASTALLRFLLPPAEQARVDPASIQVDDTPYSASPAFGAPYPQSMRLRFRITNPANGAPQLWPLFPGTAVFRVDPTAPGSLPDPAVDTLVQSAYPGWKTRGRLLVLADRAAADRMALLQAGLEVTPNMVWYEPVVITAPFLFTTFVSKLSRSVVGGFPEHAPTDPDWAKHAAFHFLRGDHTAVFKAHPTDPAQDDVAANPMPTAVMDTNGNVDLRVSSAAWRRAEDGPDDAFETQSPASDITDPAHPRNGALPARHVYRSLRPNLIGGSASSAVLDAFLADWPNAPRYLPIRFTRTWKRQDAQGKPLPTCSIHFPAQTVTVKDSGGSTLVSQRLPAHGVLYVTQPGLASAAPPGVTVSVTPMKFLDAAVPSSFREPGQQAPLPYTLGGASPPHVLLRTALGEEILVEPLSKTTVCTYATLRRFVRALVDQRVAGGRLNFVPESTGPLTRSVMNQAFTAAPGSSATAELLAANKPPLLGPFGFEDAGTTDLLSVLSAFFPANVPAQNIGGSTTRAQIFNYATVAVHLWNTFVARFQDPGTMRNYPDSHVGRGGPGGAVSLGLAAYHLNPAAPPPAGQQQQPLVDLERLPNESEADYHDRIVGRMLDGGLKPGAPLQLWTLPFGKDEYEEVRTRTSKSLMALGHSTLFLEYTKTGGTVDGFAYLDFTGVRRERRVKLDQNGKRLLHDPTGFDAPIWIAANWTD
jgi:hypothetical protein